MRPELIVFSDSEHTYATFPIAISLLREKAGWKFPHPRPFYLIFTILSQFLNTTGAENYSIRAIGKWHCEDTVLKGPAHLAPLGDFGSPHNGHNARIVGENAPGAFYQSLFALVLAALRFKKRSWWRRKVAIN